MILIRKYESWKTILPYLIIISIIFIFNIISIWGFNGILTDDQGYYFNLFNKTINDLHFKRNILHAIFTLEIIKIATSTSVFFARFLILFLFSIPSALLLFYISHNHFQLNKFASTAIAVFPFILPNEVRVPTYLVGSYMLPAILFALTSVHFILKFSKRTGFPITDFILAATFYYLATESTELIASMLPAFLFLIFIFRKLSYKQFLLGSLISFIAIRKAILIISKPSGAINSVHNNLTASEIKFRTIHFLDFINPFHGLFNAGILNIILIIIILSGMLIVILKPERLKYILDPNQLSDKPPDVHFLICYFLFPLTWLAFSTIPFLFYSHDFTSRYFTIASIAFGFMLVISTGILTGSITNRKNPFIYILILGIIFMGFNRQIHFNSLYRIPRDQFISLEQTLETCNLPGDAQIVVASPGNTWLSMGNGVTDKSNGTLQYILKRRDVRGQIMEEKCFYDPFHLYNNPWNYRSMDIDTTKKTCLFRCFYADSSRNKRMHYALRWTDDKSKDSPWTIFHFNEQGMAANLISGKGYKGYESAVDSLFSTGINREDILFGGIPERNDSLRLGL